MPTHEQDPAFQRDFQRLPRVQQERFIVVLSQFIADLRGMETRRQVWFRPGLVRKLSGTPDLFEMRWAPDGRATFSIIADAKQVGKFHIRWRRCGTHEILP